MKVRTASVSALTILALAIGIDCAAQRTYTLKIATQAPEQSVWGRTLKEKARELTKKSKGRLKLKIYLSGVQGSESTVLRKIRIGQLHGAAFLGPGLATICPESMVLMLPLLFKTEAEVGHVLTDVTPELDKYCRNRGFEAMGWPRIGFSYIYSKDDIRTIKQFRKCKPWLIEGDPLITNLYKILETAPISTSVADVLPALQSGLIRTVFSPPSALIALQWHSRVKYRLETKLNHSVGIIVISNKQWKKLPGDLQKMVRDMFKSYVDSLNKSAHKQDVEALELVERKGMIKTIQLDPAAAKTIAKATDEVSENMFGKGESKKVLDRIRQLLVELRKKPKKVR